jgi:hypothetical protein
MTTGQEQSDSADHSWLWGNQEQSDINVVLVDGGQSTATELGIKKPLTEHER